jgi:hypothetical protein
MAWPGAIASSTRVFSKTATSRGSTLHADAVIELRTIMAKVRTSDV